MDKSKSQEVASKQLDRVLAFFTRVEAKASFVFALNSAMLGTIAVRVERSDFDKWPNVAALAIACIGLIASCYFVYRCSFPSLAGGHSSLVYFKEIAKLREQEFVKSYKAQSEDALIDDLASQIWRNSQILSEKFWSIKIAFVITALSLLPWAAFLAIASVQHLPLPRP
jgi:hypothetical protein